jgi:Flp pilus assembly pilin Flp
MLHLYLQLRNWFQQEEGQDLIEYALLIVFIAVIVAAVLPAVGNGIAAVFNNIVGFLAGGAGGT